MKSILTALILASGLIFTPLAANSQEQDGCFMSDSNGKPLDLSHLCGEASQNNLNTQNVSNPQSNSNGVFRLPIKRRLGGIPVVEVVFNGKHSFEMMLDTGASATVLTPEMAKTIGVPLEGSVLAMTPGGNVQTPVGRVKSAQAGGAKMNNLTVLISEYMDVGLLGQNFFGHYDVTIKRDVIEFRVRR